jgi:hypothetical protein
MGLLDGLADVLGDEGVGRVGELVDDLWDNRQKIVEMVDTLWDKREELLGVVEWVRDNGEELVDLAKRLPRPQRPRCSGRSSTSRARRRCSPGSATSSRSCR